MSDAATGDQGGAKVIPQSAGAKFKSANNGSGETYDAGTNSQKVRGANSWEMPNGRNMVDTGDFWDESEDSRPGKKTGEWSVSGVWHKGSAGLQAIKDAHDKGETIELACAGDEANYSTSGYECTVYVSELNISSDANGEITFDATFTFADGDGWSPLQN